jgi:diguanylate cyclase (GGDEF)-like protein
MNRHLDAEELEQLIRRQLADPAYRDTPLYESLQALWNYQRKQVSRLEQICRLSDTYHAISRERELSSTMRFERQLQQLAKIIRISDRYQQMMLDLTVKLKVVASHDALTGLRNRREAEQVLAHEWLRSRRHSLPLTLVMFDVDRFKQINDRFGHAYGDMVLQQVARAAVSTLRSTDLIMRWGGEEFLVVAPHTDVAGGMILAQKIRRAVVCHSIPARELVTISLGVAQLLVDESIDGLLRRSDQAMYRAKEEGRDRVSMAPIANGAVYVGSVEPSSPATPES